MFIFLYVHVLYLNIKYVFMEYKKDEHKFIQKKNSIYRHWPDRFHMFLSLVITWGGQLNMVHVLSILWQTLDQIMMFYLMVALTSQSFWVCVLVSEGDCCTVDYTSCSTCALRRCHCNPANTYITTSSNYLPRTGSICLNVHLSKVKSSDPSIRIRPCSLFIYWVHLLAVFSPPPTLIITREVLLNWFQTVVVVLNRPVEMT